MTVVDASAVVDYLAGDRDQSHRVASAIRGRSQVEAPELLYLEVAHALRRMVRRTLVSPALGERSVGHLARMAVRAYPHDWLVAPAWDLRDRLSVYDASYVVLASLLGSDLITADRGMASVARDVLGTSHVQYLGP